MAPKWKRLLTEYAGQIAEIKQVESEAEHHYINRLFREGDSVWDKASRLRTDLTTDITAEYHDVPGPNRARGIKLFWENAGL